jgi:hypothetical protein
MADQCTFGSQPKPGAALYVWLTWNAFVAWVASKLGRLGSVSWIWWPDVPVSVDDFCATEVPIPDAPTVAEWLGMFTFDPVAHATVENYLLALFRASVWETVCECSPDPGGGDPCVTTQCVFDTPGVDFANASCALGSNCTYLNPGICDGLWTGATRTVRFPAGQHHVTLTVMPDVNHDGTIEYYTASRGETTLGSYTTGVGGSWSFDAPTADSDMKIVWRVSTGLGGGSATIKLEFSNTATETPCSSTPVFTPPDPDDPTDIPDRPGDPTCTTTADLCAAINRLSAQLGTVGTWVNWLQSAAAPTGYALGTPIAISGSGTLSVQDIVGLLVECSAPTMWRRTLDSPPRYIPKLGAIHFGDASGDLDEQQIHYLEQLVMGPPPLTTVVAYSFGTGVTATITPLQRLK